MIKTVELEQEIFDVYTTFPDKDNSFEFCQGFIFGLEKYNLIDDSQAQNAYSYNKNIHRTFE